MLQMLLKMCQDSFNYNLRHFSSAFDRPAPVIFKWDFIGNVKHLEIESRSVLNIENVFSTERYNRCWYNLSAVIKILIFPARWKIFTDDFEASKIWGKFSIYRRLLSRATIRWTLDSCLKTIQRKTGIFIVPWRSINWKFLIWKL